MQNLSLPDVLVEVEKRGFSFAKLLAIPEQDDWVYSDGKSTSCVAFILEMYKEAGLFGELASSIQVTEFTVSWFPGHLHDMNLDESKTAFPFLLVAFLWMAGFLFVGGGEFHMSVCVVRGSFMLDSTSRVRKVTYLLLGVQIKDAYSLKFFENNSSRLPKWCKADDNVKLPFCQIRGKYRMELPGYNSMDLYPHMNERCPSMPPKYYRPQSC
ncbi:hypothetical protein MTR67_033264 [Solanum verrucosum]|uniref:Uncharacterized protein n=1 Tax=Solanum verrucosum TaxID=315347 RepID=A0AAF0U670_SOLVR|nr:hypothetical protein MTR67_033264 [Solanum verrucosum]